MTNHYKTLNISENASAKEIKVAFRKLAVAYHPDKNKNFNAKQKFIEIKNAYDILSNPTKRSIHDNELFNFRTVNQQTKQSSDYKYSTNEDVYNPKVSSKNNKLFAIFGIVFILIILVTYLIQTYDRIDVRNNYQLNNKTVDSSSIEIQKIKENLKNVEPIAPQSGELKF